MSEELAILESCLKEAESVGDGQQGVGEFEVDAVKHRDSHPLHSSRALEHGTSAQPSLKLKPSGACGLMIYLAMRGMMQCRRCCTFTSDTRLWVRRVVWPWWAPAGIFLRPVHASWSSTFRSAKLSARLPHTRTPTRRTSCPRPPRPTSRRKSTRKTQSSALNCENFTNSTLFLWGGGFGDFSCRLHLKGLKNVWILVTQNYYARTMFFLPPFPSSLTSPGVRKKYEEQDWSRTIRRDTGR
ncbi:uncharacterized protein LOC113121020 [Carassius auratus]|uniref:Uncharacterized protein LOC113121020 n=1 Tax=Carassius auratus TaxID=7957 RepID=A0A6P6RNA9_CARAU|nr:uncharacterized protein LOC113121020 [Carassius auratus]